KRGAIGGRPGRPMLKRWPNVLIELAVEDAKYRKVPGGPELLSAIDQLDRTFAEVPFGNPADVRPAAEQVDEACQTLLNGLKEKQYTTDDARRLFVDLCRLASADNAYLDYDSA